LKGLFGLEQSFSVGLSRNLQIQLPFETDFGTLLRGQAGQVRHNEAALTDAPGSEKAVRNGDTGLS